MPRATREEIENRILGGFNQVLHANRFDEKHGKQNPTITEQLIEEGSKRTVKDNGKAPRNNFIPSAPGFYNNRGREYTEMDGKLVKTSTSK